MGKASIHLLLKCCFFFFCECHVLVLYSKAITTLLKFINYKTVTFSSSTIPSVLVFLYFNHSISPTNVVHKQVCMFEVEYWFLWWEEGVWEGDLAVSWNVSTMNTDTGVAITWNKVVVHGSGDITISWNVSTINPDMGVAITWNKVLVQDSVLDVNCFLLSDLWG